MVENKRKIIKRISSIFIACASALMLCISPFLPKIQPKTMIASADTSDPNYTFNGSNLLISMTVSYYQNGVNLGNSDLGYFIPEITMSRNGFSIDYFGSDTQKLTDGHSNIRYFNSSFSGSFTFDSGTEVLLPLPWSGYFMKGWYHCESDFNFDVYKVQIYSDFNARPLNWTHIKYYDSNDNYCDFAFQFYSETPDDLSLEDRTYFFSNSLSDKQSYNSGFQAGQSFGYSSGYSDGETSGYSNGQKVGYNSGYNVGYQDGVNGANTYSFYNLISAVIDAPVQAFMGLFNFELLGVNLADFFLSLLTLSFIVTILRLLL